MLANALRPTWEKGMFIIAYFVFIGLVNIIIPWEAPFYVLAWPLYVLGDVMLLAALVEVAFIYILAVILTVLRQR